MTDRYERLFSDAERNLEQRLEALFADHAAKGRLQSGATIKASVRAFDQTTSAAIQEALQGIGTITEHAGPKRRSLLSQLNRRLAEHHHRSDQYLREKIERIGLGSDFQHARPLIESAKSKHDAIISDFAEGWTAPPDKPWKDRHPIIFAIIIAAIGVAVGVVGKTATDQLSQSSPTQSKG